MDTFPPPENDLSYVSFKDVSWLQTFGLDENNVLDYFALSQFYDRSCNNQVLRMQLQFTAGGANFTREEFSKKLQSMTGAEYEVVKAQPPRLFIIHKQIRTSPSTVSLLESYYVLDGCIYKCPNLHTLISHRIISSLHYLKSAIDYADEWLQFDPTLSRYKIKTEAEEATDFDMEKPSLDGISRDKIDFITQINAQFMNLPQQ